MGLHVTLSRHVLHFVLFYKRRIWTMLFNAFIIAIALQCMQQLKLEALSLGSSVLEDILVHPLHGRQKQVGWVKIYHVQRITRYNSKTAQERRIVPIKFE